MKLDSGKEQLIRNYIRSAHAAGLADDKITAKLKEMGFEKGYIESFLESDNPIKKEKKESGRKKSEKKKDKAEEDKKNKSSKKSLAMPIKQEAKKEGPEKFHFPFFKKPLQEVKEDKASKKSLAMPIKQEAKKEEPNNFKFSFFKNPSQEVKEDKEKIVVPEEAELYEDEMEPKKEDAKGQNADKIKGIQSKKIKVPELIEPEGKISKLRKDAKVIDKYDYEFRGVSITAQIYQVPKEPSLYYDISMPEISITTKLILEEIRLKLIEITHITALESSEEDLSKVDLSVEHELMELINSNFPSIDEKTKTVLFSYSVAKILGLGEIEIIRSDQNLEEIAINRAKEPVWVYHKKYGWLKTNVLLQSEEEILHLSSKIGRRIGREITTLRPLLDAHLENGDRVNATMQPITVNGNSITLRKFAKDPWTITKFLKSGTISAETASLLWLAIQYELSAIIVGGTASGKTSTLNVLSSFIPPNQRIISIEDTRELMLPSYLHWLPMLTRLPNAEGKGEIAMEDLLVNSLRMRPDRILVGEIRKKEQAETLLEAIHTGHSCYATFHANNAIEALIRLTNPPISIPKTMMNAISLFIVQYRNRRSGLRRTFQLAEITESGEVNVIFQFDPRKDELFKINKSKSLMNTLKLFTGMSDSEINKDLKEKMEVLNYMVKMNLEDIEKVGNVMSYYYSDKAYLKKMIASKKPV